MRITALPFVTGRHNVELDLVGIGRCAGCYSIPQRTPMSSGWKND